MAAQTVGGLLGKIAVEEPAANSEASVMAAVVAAMVTRAELDGGGQSVEHDGGPKRLSSARRRVLSVIERRIAVLILQRGRNHG